MFLVTKNKISEIGMFLGQILRESGRVFHNVGA